MPTENRLPSTEPRCPIPNTDSSTSPACPAAPPDWRPGVFDHHRLDAYVVAREALVRGDALAP